ncbi:hypothetical protein [Methanosarcina sp. WH1]|uniref:hypothetical protein n=1 Tax=Methanosarcina sp. WH1 TaxID=1434102 RepID=UPI000AAF05AA|nr:hypothetical protein [Methanosarcina sp. WH1]
MVSFEKTVPVYLREYNYKVLSKTESAWTGNGTATVSYSGVSPGAYRVRIDGIAEDEA